MPRPLLAGYRRARATAGRAVSRARRRLPSRWGGALHPAEVQSRVRDLDTDPRAFELELLVGGERVASGRVVRLWRHRGLPGYWLAADEVRPDLRGRGLGRVMHARRLHEAARRGIDELYVSVTETNGRSLASLRAAGFRDAARPEWEARLRPDDPARPRMRILHRRTTAR